MSNPKERFLKLFYAAVCNFESETGCEVHAVEMERISTKEPVDMYNKTTITEYKLDLR